MYTVIADSASLSNTWDFAERWQIAVRGDWVNRTSVVDDGDSDIGLWAGGGILYRLGRWQFGADLRYTDASVEVSTPGGESLELDSGGLHTGVFAGWSW